MLFTFYSTVNDTSVFDVKIHPARNIHIFALQGRVYNVVRDFCFHALRKKMIDTIKWLTNTLLQRSFCSLDHFTLKELTLKRHVFELGPKLFEMHVFARFFLINQYLRCTFLMNEYLRYTFLHGFGMVFARLLHVF